MLCKKCGHKIFRRLDSKNQVLYYHSIKVSILCQVPNCLCCKPEPDEKTQTI
jgi:hypothetical protein